jgi:ectoine hydroxylase-related dioxygenase (phytanoyl-CoA dioxygenase family)
MDAIQSILTDKQKNAFTPVAIELKKGQCTFHHPRMIHGSYTNMTEHQRRATVINVFKDGVCSASDEPLLQGTPIISSGVKVTGKFFPKLFPL